MVKTKNKFTKKALAFASAFIILCSILIIPCLAQAPNIPVIGYNSSINNITVMTSDGLNPLAYVFVKYVSSSLTEIESINIIYTDYFYSNIYSGNSENDVDYILDNNLDIVMYFSSNGRLRQYNGDNIDFLSALVDFSGDIFYIGNYDTYYIPFSNDYENQFTYWENEIEAAESNGYNDGYDEGLLFGYDQGYEIGLNDGKSIGYSNGYTQAVKDMDSFERGLYDIFNAPFVFVKNISTFEIFGVNLLWILSGILLICLGFILIKFIGGALPL